MTYLEYKGYSGTIEPELEDNILYGKIAFIRDLVTYEAATLKELEKEFRASVDDYLETCAELNKEPNKPFKGSFNVRIGSDLHREAMMQAQSQGINLNEFVKKAIESSVHPE
jgi:predicted HicB family RNase H-like nuclease